MEFGILGPLLVRDDSGPRQVSAAKQRVVLAALLLQPGQVVPMDALAETVWDGRPPKSAMTSMRNYIMRLRNGLGAAGERISSHSGGYLIEVGEHELDSLRFARLCELGAAAFHEDAFDRAATTLGQALALWRGPALADVPSDTLHRDECHRLAEARLDALELKLEAENRLGRHGPVIAELRGLTAAHPERERLWVQLMTALYHSGRQSEALAAYQRVRRILSQEIGVEPGSELRAAHRQILTEEPLVERPTGRAATQTGHATPTHRASQPRPRQLCKSSRHHGRPDPGLTPATPCQIPGDLADFTGRAQEFGELFGRLAAAGPPIVITGPAGIGKSALAIHLAHAARSTFPDGILYADLRGPDGTPLPPELVLTSSLSSLGFAPGAIPTNSADQTALLRSVLANRRLLLVLDNAASRAQLEPLLPGATASRVLITSRDRLAAPAGAHRLGLGPLTAHESAQLLGKIAGPARSQAEPLAMAEVVTACGRLPLALRAAGTRLAARPWWNVRHLADRLADGRRVLDELSAAGFDIRASFTLSYAALDSAAARALRLLALLDVPTVGVETAAALLEVPPSCAERLLESLVDVHLLASDQPNCYGFPVLIRLFARERLFAVESEAERGRAVERALAFAARAREYRSPRRADVAVAASGLGPGTRRLPSALSIEHQAPVAQKEKAQIIRNSRVPA